MKILVAYDGTLNAKTALKYGIDKAGEGRGGGAVTVVGVFKSAMFVDYGAGPRAEEVARGEFMARMKEAEAVAAQAPAGVRAEVLAEVAESEEEAAGLAESMGAGLVLAPAGLRALARLAPCPVCLVPGNILVPVDSAGGALKEAGRIAREARATASKVTILGVVPVHLYGLSEKAELEKIRRETSAAASRLAEALAAQGVKTASVMSEGFPDEEIMRAADRLSASMVIITSPGEEPSELSKAADIISEETERPRRPFMVIPERPA